MNLVTRAQWGARPAKHREALARKAQHGTAVHYSASDADEQADHANCSKRVRGIQSFHMDGRGWSDIAYSFLACKHGFVYEGRGRGIRTAANGTNSGNDGYHAVCFLGDDTAGRDDVTDQGREAIRDAVRHCNAWAGVSAVRPHSWFKATGCPGDDLRGWLQQGMPVASAPPPEEADMPLDQDAKEWIEGRLDLHTKEIVDKVTDLYRLAARGELNGTIDQGSTHFADSVRGTREAILDALAEPPPA
jgi:hypothetical protein